MRIVSWNCRIGGFRQKAAHMARLDPRADVLVVQEVEQLERYSTLAGSCQPTFRDRAIDPRFPRRGIGVFSYTSAEIRAADTDQPNYCFRRYEVTVGELTFQLAAVWTYDTGRRATAYRQAATALRQHAAWILGRPTIVIGDFNANKSFQGTVWCELAAELDALRLVSAYHSKMKEPLGAESIKTHFPRGSYGNATHLDYCFVPDRWVEHIQSVQIGRYEDWRAISDHAPLIVDLRVPAKDGGNG